MNTNKIIASCMNKALIKRDKMITALDMYNSDNDVLSREQFNADKELYNFYGGNYGAYLSEQY